MPDYSVDIAIAVKGAKELKAVRTETTALSKEITTLNKLANKQSKTLPNSFKTLNQVLGQAKGNLNKVALGTDRYFRAISDVIDKEERLNRAYKKQKTDFKVIQRLRRKGLDINKQNIQQIRNELAAEIKLERAKRRTGNASIGKALAGKFSGTASSAIIGGSFPFLFGQTGAAAVGGGLGGAAGGLIGGQFGFALSIAGTAIGSAIDKNEKFNQSLAALNVQFSTTSGGTQILAADVDKLAKRLSITKEEAIAALGAFKEFGSGSVAKSLVSIFNSDSAGFEGIAGSSRQAELANQIFEARKKIGIERAIELQQQNLSNNAGVVELALAEARAKAENDIAVAKAKQITFGDRAKTLAEEYLLGTGGMDASRYGEGRADKMNEEFEKNRKQRLEDFTKALEKYRELLGLTNEAQGQFGESGVLAFSAINDKVKDLQDEMLKLQNPINQVLTLSQTMAQSFESSFAGIIKGTMTVADAFRNMLNAMVNHFIQSAAKMAANQFQQSLLGMIGQSLAPAIGNTKGIGPVISGSQYAGMIPSNPITSKILNNPVSGGLKPTSILPGLNVQAGSRLAGSRSSGMRADGGPVRGGGSYIVGERGPELFTPGISGMITPNDALGGAVNVSVNVDASGSSVQGNENRGKELGLAISAAVQSEIVNQKRPGGLLA